MRRALVPGISDYSERESDWAIASPVRRGWFRRLESVAQPRAGTELTSTHSHF